MLNSIRDIFSGAAAKYLSAVDAGNRRSASIHQHEIGGLPSVGFKQFLGEPGKSQEFKYPCLMAYIHDDGEVELCRDEVTWYNSRRRVEHRGPEYRLYYKDNEVTANLAAGDFFLIAKHHDNSLLMVFAPPDSTYEFQLRHLFGIEQPSEKFRVADMPTDTLILPLKLLLEELGIEAFDERSSSNDLDIIFERFGTAFPKTAEFSSLARELSEQDSRADPDGALVGWMDREERLFRAFERHVVQEQLRKGFGTNGDDVDEFIRFSLSVQNRRKSRVGHAFENHLGKVFNDNGLPFEKGGAGRVTENNAKPDFMFPGFIAYHNLNIETRSVFLLGAKTTCKDRWRQVLAEGDRLPVKYLATLEAGISSAQTSEMQAKQLQLIVPASVHSTYSSDQQQWLFRLQDFISLVRSKLS